MFVEKFSDIYNEKTLSKAKTLSQKFSNGVVAAATAAALGGEIGILTARAAQGAHQSMIDIFSKTIEKPIKKSFNYFVNDAELAKRIGFLGRNTALKKLHILVEYATGFKLLEDGSIEKRKAFGNVKFYDDETKNLVILTPDVWKEYLGLLEKHLENKNIEPEQIKNLIDRIETAKGKIKVLDIKAFASEKLLGKKTNFSALISKIKNFMKGGKIHFFDLDGTVFTHSVKMFINKQDKTLFAITQEEFAEGHIIPKSAQKLLDADELKTRDTMSSEELNSILTKAMKGTDGYSIDFRYFSDPDAIATQAVEKNLEKKNYEERWIYKDGEGIHIPNSEKLLAADTKDLSPQEKSFRKQLLHAKKGWHGYSMTKEGSIGKH